VFLTNKSDLYVMDRAREIYTQTNHIARCFALLDCSAPDIEQTWKAYRREHRLNDFEIVTFDIVDLERELSVASFKRGQIIPGSVHMPLLWLSRRLGFRLYWVVEDDVYFKGNWAELVQKFKEDNSSLLCSHLTDFGEILNWPWWSSLKAPTEAVEGGNWLESVQKGFFPIYRISAVALGKVLECQRAGWSGHFEVLIPTVLRHARYSVSDLGSDLREALYSDGMIKSGEGSGKLSTLRVGPPVTNAEIVLSDGAAIFHPVKRRVSRSLSRMMLPALLAEHYAASAGRLARRVVARVRRSCGLKD
jgi:hypothetical protein